MLLMLLIAAYFRAYFLLHYVLLYRHERVALLMPAYFRYAITRC